MARGQRARGPRRKGRTGPAGREAKAASRPEWTTPLYRDDEETLPFFRSRWAPLAAVAAAAALARFVHFFFIRAADPSFAYCFKGIDSYTYDQWALKILDGDWASRHQRVFYYGPVYPYFLALIYGVFGHRYAVAHAVQFLLGVATSLLVFLGAAQWFSRRVALAAALGVALCPGVLFYESTLLPATIAFLTLAAFLWLMGLAQNRPWRRGLWLAMGLCLGVSALQRANSLLCAGGVAVWTAVYFRHWPWRRRVLAFAVFALGIALALLPTTLHNRLIGKRWVLVTGNGPNLMYIGNAHDATGTFSYPPSFLALREEEKKREVSMSAELRRDILEHPRAWVRLMAKKAYMFWASYDPPDNFSYNLYRRFSPLLRFNPLGFSLLVPLGIVGMFLSSRRWRDLLSLHAFVVAFWASIVVVFVVGRYRLPVVLALSGFSGLAFWQGWAWLRGRRFAPLLAGALSVALLWILLGLYRAVPFGIRPNDFGMFARFYASTGRADDAIALLREGSRFYRRRKPRSPEGKGARAFCIQSVQTSLAQRLLEEERWAEAQEALEELVRDDLAGEEQTGMLVMAYLRQNKTDQAAALLEQLVRRNPDNAQWRDLLRQIRVAPAKS